ncbi:MAG: DNA mismatch repair endonuclease MutL [Prevotella sp.]|nr:DNA mismatch repair endonuclease MutL [Alistipes senegalensis]MCM1357544.1 DNA mismatch repair endonuclease MutL [Prevotella sp.]MCM1472810.1 DNA mismatch repair endonuclease MutL [Muribaculaceae bacterium]
MSSINILSREVAELIAAGEVIEKPASVIKELVENSIDAGAGHITVEIKHGGKTYMRVTDDGCGITFDDVPKAFMRHATSKISEKQDLNNIYTLGFRGEALASVAAVSKVEIITKPENENSGTSYSMENNKGISHEKCACPDGTTIIIRDLFYNVPARCKFMKKDVTEANAVSHIIQKTALSHPEIAFRFIRDNRVEINSSGDGELLSAIYAVYGRDMAHDMIPVDYENNNIHVSGYVIKPLYAKNNRSFQNFFVNGRYVNSKICSSAVESAYENMLMTGKFPACVLMISINSADTDVNIHPSKLEVRFSNEKAVSETVFFAVKNAMVKDGLIYEFEFPAEKKEPEISEEKISEKPVEEIPEKEEEFSLDDIFTPVEEIEKAEAEISENPPENAVIPEEPEKISAEKPVMLEGFNYISQSIFEDTEKTEIPEPEKPEVPAIHAVGEVMGLYIIAETDDRKMIIIDKHAAHERIIFERLKSRNCRQYTQMLITEIKILFTSEEIGVMEENKELLADMGFIFDFSESPFIKVKAVPTFITDTDIEGVISEIAENLKLHVHNPQSHMLDDVLHTVACRSAIKANHKTSLMEMQSLAEQVYYNDNIRHCPHGRPVMFTMSESNISHQFRRT